MPLPKHNRQSLEEKGLFEFFEFHRGGHVLPDAPLCGLTLRAAGSMRFRWNETNQNREKLLSLFDEFASQTSQGLTRKSAPVCDVQMPGASPSMTKVLVPVQLDHTHIVYDVHEAGDTNGKIGDGIITVNRELIPTVTVADCMPLYLYDPVTGLFGIVHSGWKGTGIAADAIGLACREYGARAEDFCVVIGPHIRDCCYIVNEERAAWFSKNFTPECVRPLEDGVEVSWNNGGGPLFRLSLEKANLAALQKAGLPRENIWIHPACTCCYKDKDSGEYIYGSNRRETSAAGTPDKFTVQAAFIIAN